MYLPRTKIVAIWVCPNILTVHRSAAVRKERAGNVNQAEASESKIEKLIILKDAINSSKLYETVFIWIFKVMIFKYINFPLNLIVYIVYNSL